MAQSNDSYVWMFAKSVVVFLVFAWLSYTAPKVFDQFHLSQLVKLVGGIPTPLKNMSLSVGMIIPNIWKNQIHVPNHQPEYIYRQFPGVYIYIFSIYGRMKNVTNHQPENEETRGWLRGRTHVRPAAIRQWRGHRIRYPGTKQ